MPHNLVVSDEEKLILDRIRADRATKIAAAATRETREQLRDRILDPSFETLTMTPAERDSALANLVELLTEIPPTE